MFTQEAFRTSGLGLVLRLPRDDGDTRTLLDTIRRGARDDKRLVSRQGQAVASASVQRQHFAAYISFVTVMSWAVA